MSAPAAAPAAAADEKTPPLDTPEQIFSAVNDVKAITMHTQKHVEAMSEEALTKTIFELCQARLDESEHVDQVFAESRLPDPNKAFPVCAIPMIVMQHLRKLIYRRLNMLLIQNTKHGFYQFHHSYSLDELFPNAKWGKWSNHAISKLMPPVAFLKRFVIPPPWNTSDKCTLTMVPNLDFGPGGAASYGVAYQRPFYTVSVDLSLQWFNTWFALYGKRKANNPSTVPRGPNTPVDTVAEEVEAAPASAESPTKRAKTGANVPPMPAGAVVTIKDEE